MPSPRHLFLIDGIGAACTTTLLTAVLAQFESIFGMPSRVLYTLAAIAAVFAIYSLACYFGGPKNWIPFLLAIAIANLAYCGLTLFLMVAFRTEITAFGIAYFAAEIVVVSTLAVYEMATTRRAVYQGVVR